jgi:thioredoxin-dependent peroxiredoxin
LDRRLLGGALLKQGEDVIIAGSVSDDEAKELFGEWEAPKPYIRNVPQPS